jgi:hypothetical protein
MTAPHGRELSRVRRLIFAFVSLALLSGGGAFGIAACSSSTDPPAVPRADARAADSGDAEAQIEACLMKCEKDHPASLPKFDAIDMCWEKSCKGPCIDATGSFDAGATTKVNDGGGPICGTDTPSFTDKACDDCIEAFCCPSWKGCYEDTDCRAFDECIIDCYPPGP